MEPEELAEAQDEYDASLDRLEERRIWCENKAQEIVDNINGCMAVAYEVDAVEHLGNLLTRIRRGEMDEAHDYAYKVIEDYAKLQAELLANDRGL